MTGRDYVSLVEAARALNPKLFSLARLELLGAIAPSGLDGAMYSDLKNALGLSDGAMYSNLNALKEMGYLKEEKIVFEGKDVTRYQLTEHGALEFARVKKWLWEFVGGE